MLSRRAMLRVSAAQAGAVWAALAQQHGHEQPGTRAGGLKFFTADEAREVEAVGAQIIPADETGGAREAGGVRFIYLNLATDQHERQEAYRAGLKVLRPKYGG